MWRCPNCGEKIDDTFDLCWNCGTAQDGTRDPDFHTEPGNSTAPDDEPESEEHPEAVDPASEQSAADHQRVVELCSAADVVEAHGLCDLLEEAGISVRVVGEYLVGAAGGLPLGEPTLPRIWVHEADQARACEIIERYRDQTEHMPIEPPVGDETPEWETPVEQEAGPIPSDVRFRFLSQGFFIVGLACVLFGSVRAWQSSIILSKYSAMTEGERISVDVRGREVPIPGGPDQPIGKQFLYQLHTSAQYKYVVNHKVYHANIANADAAPSRATIHYDPHFPAEHVVGAVIPAWIVLVLALGSGAFLAFVAYQFR